MPRGFKFPQFDLIEIVLVAALMGGAVWAYSLRQNVDPSPETAAFREKYGSSRNSEHGEEWLIRDFFQDKRNGVFLDVGANHYQSFNNTYYLETMLGWEGIAVEPLREFEAGYVAHRPK